MTLSTELAAMLAESATTDRLDTWLSLHGAAVVKDLEKGERIVAIRFLDLNDRDAVGSVIEAQAS